MLRGSLFYFGLKQQNILTKLDLYMTTDMILIEQLSDIQSVMDRITSGEAFELAQIDVSKLNQLRIKINGNPDKYNGTLTSSMCKGLYEFQTELYKVYTSVKYKTDNLQRLKSYERDTLELTFNVEPGCTEIIGDLKELAKAISEAFCQMTTGMTGREKTLCFLFALLCITGGIVGSHVADLEHEEQMEQLTVKQAQQDNTSENEQMKIMRDGILAVLKTEVGADSEKQHQVSLITNGLQEHSAKGYESIIKTVSDADSVSIKGVSSANLDNAKIQSFIHNPVDRPTTEERTIHIDIDSIKRAVDSDKLTITCHEDGQAESTFTVTADLSYIEPEETKFLFDAFRDGKTVTVLGSFKVRSGIVEKGMLSSVTIPRK